MNLDIESIMENANMKYASLKMERGLCDAYTPPECLPEINSDQVKAIAFAIVEAINNNGK